jgi:hypothetical protein
MDSSGRKERKMEQGRKKRTTRERNNYYGCLFLGVI